VTFIGQWQGKLYVNLKWNTFFPIINPQLTVFPFTSYHYEVKSWLIISIYEKLNNHCLQNMNLHREIKYQVFSCKKNSKNVISYLDKQQCSYIHWKNNAIHIDRKNNIKKELYQWGLVSSKLAAYVRRNVMQTI
jgi:hypothetical protein